MRMRSRILVGLGSRILDGEEGTDVGLAAVDNCLSKTRNLSLGDPDLTPVGLTEGWLFGD
jgi:hypothetical protein